MKNNKRVVLSLLLCIALLISQPMGSIYAAEIDGNIENTSSTTTIVSDNNGDADTSTVKKSSEETATSETSEETVTSETSEETATSETSEETVTSETSEETVTSETSEETATSETSEETTTRGTTEETTTSGTTEVTTTSGTMEETTTSGTTEETTTSCTTEETTTSGTTEETTTSGTTEETTTSGTTEETTTTSEVSEEETTTSSAVENETTTTNGGIEEAKLTEEVSNLIELESEELLPVPMELEGEATSIKISDYNVDSDYDSSLQYFIEDAADMKMLAKLVNGVAKNTTGDSITVDFSDAKIEVSASAIDLSEGAWIPIGKDGKSFKGTIEGNDVVISGISITSESYNYQGLFGYVDNATFKNITVEGSIDCGGSYIGGIAGYAKECLFENCTNKIIITGNASKVGGIVGCCDSWSKSQFNKCINQGNITGNDNLGGILGFLEDDSQFDQCINKGNITGNESLGGILGGCSWNGESVITKSLNSGEVSGKTKVGGIAGYCEGGAIENCYAIGDVIATEGIQGGIMGYHDYATIKNSFYYNESTPLKISGESSDNITNCFYLEATEYGTSYGGEAKNKEDFLHNEVVYGLNGRSNHRNVWEQGKSYPELVQGVGETVYRIHIAPFAFESTLKANIEGSSTYVTIDPMGGKNIFVKNGEKVSFELQGNGELITNAVPEDSCIQEGKRYTVTVNNSDVTILYGLKEELDKPTVTWYRPELTEYNIGTEKELIGLSMLVNGKTAYGQVDFSGKTVKLTESVTLKKEWQPIGTTSAAFAGVFNGDSKSISGLSCGSESSPTESGYQGIFGYNTGTIQNLTASGEVCSKGDYVGGIVGYNKGEIENCTFESGSVLGKDYVGGIAGYNINSEIKELKNAATISGENYVGGLFGKSEDTICERGSSYVNSGAVTAKNNYAGGIVGYVESAVKFAENNGDITGNNYVGGIAGYADGRILQIQSKGTIKGVDYIGGIVGYTKYNIIGESEKETVSGKIQGNNYVGGIAGYVGGDISKVTVANDSIVSGVGLVGGIVGEHDGVEINDFIVMASVKGSTSGAIAGSCKSEPDVKNGFYYCLSEKNPVLFGTGEVILEDVYYLAEEENESGAKTVEQFRSGEVAWMLDGAEEMKETTSWTQNKEDAYPSLGDDPVFKIRFMAEIDITTENAIKLEDGIAETQIDSLKKTQIVYLKKGELINLDVTLADSYEVMFTPAIDFNIKDGKYVITVDNNYDVAYSFAVNVPAEYEWYLNAEVGTDGKKLYNIKTENDLKGFSNLVNGFDFENSGQSEAINFEGDIVNLLNDLNIKSGNWSAIGTSSTAFSGTFDGNNYSITDLKLSSIEDNQGLFGYINNSVIKNLSVTGIIDNSGKYTGGIIGCALGNCNFENLQFGSEGKIIGRAKYIGGIVGGTILNSEGQKAQFKNCKNKGMIQATSDAVGGIVGIVISPNKSKVEANFTNCENLGDVIGDASYTGGIAGVVASFARRNDYYIYTAVDNNKNSGKVKGCKNTGGIIGYLTGSKDKTSKVFNCYNDGTVSGSGENTGGIVGYKNSYSEIKACYNIENVEGESSNVGGIVGKLLSYPGNVSHCYNVGTVTGSTENTGGIAGYASSSSDVIVNNYNKGDVKGKDNVGGIIGSLSSKNFKNNYNTGSVLATGNAAGGIIGSVKKSGSNIQACYNTGKIEGKGIASVVGGITGKNSSESYGSGWDETLKRCKANSKVSGCYNTGQVLSDKGVAGNITGRYFELNENCYALNRNGSDKKYVTVVTKGQLNSAEFAYLLDGGDKQNRTTNWAQGEDGPIFIDKVNKEIYKLTINVSGKGLLSDEICKNISESATRYICKDTEINLSVAPDSGQKLLKLRGSNINGSDINDLLEKNEITFSMPSSDVELTAIFVAEDVLEDSVIVMFGANGGVFADGKTITTMVLDNGSKLAFPDTPTKEGYNFKGWYDAKSEGNKIIKGVEFTKDATYYAQWTKIEGTFNEGDGSKDNPYIISGIDDFYLMAGKVNSGDTNYIEKYYKIADDVENIIIGEDWEAIGTEENSFRGVFDGNDTRIESKADTGIFGNVRSAEIRNFRLDTDICGDRMVGGVVNYFSGDGARKTLNFENITVTGNVTGISGVGGLLGGTDLQRHAASGTWDLVKIRECRNVANISTTEFMAGGLVGYLYPEFEIENCINTGNVTSGHAQEPQDYIDVSAAGGLAGWFISGRINCCVNIGDIRGDEPGVGGLLGYVSFGAQAGESYIKNSYNLGNITAPDIVGGIAGKSMAVDKSYSIENCYNYGTIDATNKRGKSCSISSDAGDQSINCFTLEGTAPKANDSEQVVEMSKERFESGEVAYLLDGGGTTTRSGIWTQNISEGYPIFGTPYYYKLNVSGNEGEYTTTVTRTDGVAVKSDNGETKDFYVGGGEKPLTVLVEGKSKNVVENGKKYQITYNVESIELTKNEVKENITTTKAFNMQEDCALKVTVKPSEKVEIIEPDKSTGGGSGSLRGKGDSGDGIGQGQGEQGTDIGTGAGDGTESGSQDGKGDGNKEVTSGQKEQGKPEFTVVIPVLKEDVQQESTVTASVENEEPQEQENPQDQEEVINAANSGGLEMGITGGDEELEEEQITVWEIVKKAAKENPLTIALMIMSILLIAGIGGFKRFRKIK